ncbi:hypothetical protein FHR32_007324 [Streptosporangium album]|uniref:Uncharacterized protein n=1 Tax=Streptosporangium album TaxID=47479 RepID=A0A7W7S2W2_9ACTN|nr:hypothetical protein [Streptosporangium album]MBB4942924.1 hypothetical protein [Streptosporangium album]
MLRRHRFGVPALLIMSVYVVAVAVAAVIALTVGDLGALWRLTLFTEVDEGVAVTWPNVLILVLAGMAWAWALWQSLRGPLAGLPPELDRDARRLRVALYAAVASWLFYFLMSSWPWWVAVLDAVVMWAVVVLFQPVLVRNLKHADHARAAGVLAYGGAAAAEVLDVLDWPVPRWLPLVCGLAGLIWMVLVLRAQRRDGRWQRTTVLYGVASLVGFGSVGWLLASEGNVYDDAMTAADALMMIWLARSAHELADPRHQLAPPSPLPAQPQS